MRQIVLDTETTGIDPKQGHRIIEIGCVELINRKLTGNHYHQYINPQRVVEQEAIAVHGITNEFLEDKPVFKDVYDDFMQFIEGAELVIHNAPFDVGFIDHELKIIGRGKWKNTATHCTVLDTLALARKMFPGQKNNLDALCRRFGIDNSHRSLHGALLDSEILADVFLLMTGGQKDLKLAEDDNSEANSYKIKPINRNLINQLKVVKANQQELKDHQDRLSFLENKSGKPAIWTQEQKKS
jgi:DNA polymerase III subunit epsilon